MRDKLQYSRYIGAVIKRITKGRISQEYMANEIGMTLSDMSNKLNGKMKITVDEFIQLCDLTRSDYTSVIKLAKEEAENE